MAELRDYLTRYWFTFNVELGAAVPPLGVGVTAATKEDALDLVRSELLGGDPLPAVVDVREDVDVGTLDPSHVLPNMGDPSRRGIWFPRGSP
jgi:hypothetical protein